MFLSVRVKNKHCNEIISTVAYTKEIKMSTVRYRIEQAMNACTLAWFVLLLANGVLSIASRIRRAKS